MRKVVFGGAISLDNRLASADHTVDWILFGDEAREFMGTYWNRFDAMLVGRKTYEFAAGQGGGMGGMATYMFSRNWQAELEEGVTLVSEDAADFVRDLKKREGKDIMLMGGGELAHSMFEAGLIDELVFNIHPLLLGAGIPLFHGMSRQVDLELKECTPWSNGCILAAYDVKN